MNNKFKAIHVVSSDLKVLRLNTPNFQKKSHQKSFVAKLSPINYETNIFRSKIVTREYQITFPVAMSKVEYRRVRIRVA